jgi:hypothetical protein
MDLFAAHLMKRENGLGIEIVDFCQIHPAVYDLTGADRILSRSACNNLFNSVHIRSFDVQSIPDKADGIAFLQKCSMVVWGD